MANPVQTEAPEDFRRQAINQKPAAPLFTPDQAERLVKAFELIGASLQRIKERMF